MYEADDEHASGRLSVSEAREDFADLVNRVAYRGERVRVMRRGREVAAIVPIEDIELIERLEDRLDLEAARDALADPENAVPIPWEQVEAELGLDR
jgi:prevent-host-death family protein